MFFLLPLSPVLHRRIQTLAQIKFCVGFPPTLDTMKNKVYVAHHISIWWGFGYGIRDFVGGFLDFVYWTKEFSFYLLLNPLVRVRSLFR
jgi:hypothetical protein